MSELVNRALFDPARISPEILEFNKVLIEGMSGTGWVFPPKSAPALREALARSMPEPYLSESARVLSVPGSAGDIPVRIIPAERPTAVYLHCHGGGWTIGAAAGQDAALERIVTATGMTVASVDYRLAPEHPYPAGLDDCERVGRWLLDHGEAELGSGRLLIGGESAGANLALCTALRVGSDRPDAFAAIALYYGNYDQTMTPSMRESVSGVLITRGAMEWFYDQYVPDATQRADPDISPLYADLRGLPPVMLAVGTADSLRDDTLFLATRMLAAGVDCELTVVPGGEHAFDLAPLPDCQEAVATVDAFLARHAKSG